MQGIPSKARIKAILLYKGILWLEHCCMSEGKNRYTPDELRCPDRLRLVCLSAIWPCIAIHESEVAFTREYIFGVCHFYTQKMMQSLLFG